MEEKTEKQKSDYLHIADYTAFQDKLKENQAKEKEEYLHIADIAAIRSNLLKDGIDKMDDDLPQTDEVKSILNQLGELKTRKTVLLAELGQIEDRINELQDQLVKEKSRTSSVSDNIKIFEGLNDGPVRRNTPQRSQTQIIHRKSAQPSSYVDLWICNSGETEGGVEVPESFVKPARKSEPDEEYYSEPPAEVVTYDVSQTPTKTPLNDSGEADPLDKFRGMMIPLKRNTIEESEPIYANVGTIDEYMKTAQIDEANISEDSDHEILNDSIEATPANIKHHASAQLVDHTTVRNLEEAKMYTQRNQIVQSFYDSEVAYHRYLKALHKQYNHYMQLAQSKEKGSFVPMSSAECRAVYANVADIDNEQVQLVETVRRRLRDWKPDSTFHEIVYKITSNLKMYEEYVNNYTKSMQMVSDILTRAAKQKKKGGATGESASAFKRSLEEIKLDDEKTYSIQNLLFQPILQLTKRSAIVQEILVYTPARHSDHTKLRQYIDSFQSVLQSVNKSHKAKGHRKVENRAIIKSGILTERIDNGRKLRRVVLANGVMIGFKVNSFDVKWRLPLSKVTIEEDFRTEEIGIDTRKDLNKIDDKIMGLTYKRKQEQGKSKMQKLDQDIRKLTLERLKLSQTVPLNIRDIASKEIHYFLLASEYERSIWTEAINKAQMSSLSTRVTDHEIQDVIDELKKHKDQSGPEIGRQTQANEKLLSGYLSVSIDRAQGFHKNCNVWVALETDFYDQFTTQARTRIVKSQNRSAIWNEDFEIEVDGCRELVALVLNNTGSTDLLVSKGSLRLADIGVLESGDKVRREIHMTGDFKLQVAIKYTKRHDLNRSEEKDSRKTFGVPLRAICAREGDSCPYIIRACTTEIEKRGLSDVGLYRVSAAKSDIQQLKEYFDSNHPDLVRRLAQVDIHTITGALKQFLREMPEPLIPNEWAGGLIEMIRAEDWNSWSDHERKVAIIQRLLRFPKANQGSLHALFNHFKMVASVPTNKMDLNNIATVFGPTLMATPPLQTGQTDVTFHFQIQGQVLRAILDMDAFPSYEEQPMDGSRAQVPPTPARTPTQSGKSFPVPAPRSTVQRNTTAHQF